MDKGEDKVIELGNSAPNATSQSKIEDDIDKLTREAYARLSTVVKNLDQLDIKDQTTEPDTKIDKTAGKETIDKILYDRLDKASEQVI